MRVFYFYSAITLRIEFFFTFITFLTIANTIGTKTIVKAIKIKAVDAGLRNKMSKDPPDICSDCLKDFSRIGPRMTVKVIGTKGKSKSLAAYPNIPKAIRIQISKILG